MKNRSMFCAGVMLAAVTACAQESQPADAPESGAVAGEPEAAPAAPDSAGDCPVLDSREWAAWVNAMPGPDAKPALHVTGEVDMPTPGFSFDWEEGPADRSMTPVQRLTLVATPPDGMTTQVVTTETVKYEGQAITTTYGGVIVMCGGEPLAEIMDVDVAQ